MANDNSAPKTPPSTGLPTETQALLEWVKLTNNSYLEELKKTNGEGLSYSYKNVLLALLPSLGKHDLDCFSELVRNPEFKSLWVNELDSISFVESGCEIMLKNWHPESRYWQASSIMNLYRNIWEGLSDDDRRYSFSHPMKFGEKIVLPLVADKRKLKVAKFLIEFNRDFLDASRSYLVSFIRKQIPLEERKDFTQFILSLPKADGLKKELAVDAAADCHFQHRKIQRGESADFSYTPDELLRLGVQRVSSLPVRRQTDLIGVGVSQGGAVFIASARRATRTPSNFKRAWGQHEEWAQMAEPVAEACDKLAALFNTESGKKTHPNPDKAVENLKNAAELLRSPMAEPKVV